MKPNQLSKTAAYIAIKFYGLTLMKPYRTLFDEEVTDFYSNLVSHLPFPLSAYHSLLQNNRIRSALMYINEKLLPGDLMHVLMRKYCIGKMVDNLVGQGYRQLVVLGAGFDHLAAYYSRRGIHSIELDAPLMTKVKSSFVHKNNHDNEQYTVVPAYLSRDRLPAVLDTLTDIDPSQNTIVVAEGFFDYLTPDHTRQVLRQLTRYFSAPLALTSTVFALDELWWMRSSVYKTSTWMVGEKLKLHHTLQEFRILLEEHGFTIEKHLSASDMQSAYLHPRNISRPVLPGFHLLKAVYH